VIAHAQDGSEALLSFPVHSIFFFSFSLSFSYFLRLLRRAWRSPLIHILGRRWSDHPLWSLTSPNSSFFSGIKDFGFLGSKKSISTPSQLGFDVFSGPSQTPFLDLPGFFFTFPPLPLRSTLTYTNFLL